MEECRDKEDQTTRECLAVTHLGNWYVKMPQSPNMHGGVPSTPEYLRKNAYYFPKR